MLKGFLQSNTIFQPLYITICSIHVRFFYFYFLFLSILQLSLKCGIQYTVLYTWMELRRFCYSSSIHDLLLKQLTWGNTPGEEMHVQIAHPDDGLFTDLSTTTHDSTTQSCNLGL
ncbi:hypothetical protein LDENG_00087590 [Lucifuga dentata]|nr:hypothetical protein LDENG_00087590 [Lucifuga dentata]